MFEASRQMTMATFFQLKPTTFVRISTSQEHSSAGIPSQIKYISDTIFHYWEDKLVGL
jgi:hypothetical protein